MPSKSADSNQELFDIFDADNNPLGIVKPRSEVHAQMRDWHRVTHIWIVNHRKEILCQKRSAYKDSDPGKWQSFFWWHLQAWQAYEENVAAELEEELGIRITDRDRLTFLRLRKSESAKHLTHVYAFEWDHETEEAVFRDHEVEEVRWMTIETLLEEIGQGRFCNPMDEKVLEYLSGK